MHVLFTLPDLLSVHVFFMYSYILIYAHVYTLDIGEEYPSHQKTQRHYNVMKGYGYFIPLVIARFDISMLSF